MQVLDVQCAQQIQAINLNPHCDYARPVSWIGFGNYFKKMIECSSEHESISVVQVIITWESFLCEDDNISSVIALFKVI